MYVSGPVVCCDFGQRSPVWCDVVSAGGGRSAVTGTGGPLYNLSLCLPYVPETV